MSNGDLQRFSTYIDQEKTIDLPGVVSLTELERRYWNSGRGLKTNIARRYGEILPDYLRSVTDLVVLEVHFSACPEEFRTLVAQRYGELLSHGYLQGASILDLERRYSGCADGASRLLIAKRYSELLRAITNFVELEERHNVCPSALKPRVVARCKEVIEAVGAPTEGEIFPNAVLAELEKYYRHCPNTLKPLILNMYRKHLPLFLRSAGSAGLEKRYVDCHEDMKRMIRTVAKELVKEM